MNAGGQSQRLMSASALGKVSLALPLGLPMYHQLDMVIANFLPLLPNMKPGIFHGASDVIILYDLADCTDWNLNQEGFTALAHPASLVIGCGHGVYVMKENKLPKTKVSMMDCIEVLQKPSVEKMHKRNAVQNTDGKEWVYTDSVFYFDFSTAKKMLKFYRDNNGPFPCELCAYGDFLQGLGVNGNSDYCSDVKNVSTLEPKLLETRLKLYECLKDTRLNVLCLNVSKFYHIGTTKEFLDCFCDDKDFEKEIKIKRQYNCITNGEPQAKRMKVTSRNQKKLEGCVFHCNLHRQSTSHLRSVIEYCQFSMPLTVNSNSIVSGCKYVDDDVKSVYLPANTFIHTVHIKSKKGSKYVTIVCNIDDDMKKKPKYSGDIIFLNHKLSEFIKLHEVSHIPNSNSNALSLWDIKLFPEYETAKESFATALKIAQTFTKFEKVSFSNTYSVRDAMKSKDIDSMLRYRDEMSQQE